VWRSRATSQVENLGLASQRLVRDRPQRGDVAARLQIRFDHQVSKIEMGFRCGPSGGSGELDKGEITMTVGEKRLVCSDRA
jgi:hypothetical protein